jgi:hypothetical protein
MFFNFASPPPMWAALTFRPKSFCHMAFGQFCLFFGSSYWTLGGCIIKLIMAVIYGFCNKLECLSPNTRLGWKGLPGTDTNTPAYFGNRK